MRVLEQDIAENSALYCGDCNEVLDGLPADSVHLTVTSPPFGSLYTYSASERDLGNCRTDHEFRKHLGFVAARLLRVQVPGRLACIHVAQIPSLLSKDGLIGLKDFRGEVIRVFQESNWIYHGEICIDKDPQAQAIRTKSKALLFAQLRKDASWLRPALADYVVIFRKPGANAIPVGPDLTNNEWIEWARPIWYGLRESDTLRVVEARGPNDERHICPLQLGTIERCIRLWTNPGEIVLDPFAGIGSVGHEALLRGRRFVGVELKASWFQIATKNLKAAQLAAGAQRLF